MLPGSVVSLVPGIDQVTLGSGCSVDNGAGDMNAGLPGRGIIPPGQGPGLTGVLHHETYQNFSFVSASWQSISISTGIKCLPGHWMVQL